MQGSHWSESKQRWIAYEDMADKHLINALAKMDKDQPSPNDSSGEIQEWYVSKGALESVLRSRGWVRGEDGAWTIEQPPVNEAGQL